MDPVQFVWMMGIGALIGGGIIGAIAYRNLAPTRNEASNLKAELDQAREEMESYKASVNTHFDKTSELVNELTQDYVKVYKHLAEGAQVLGEGREFTHVLEQHQGKVLISVDSESAVQDTIVSEVPSDTPEVEEVSEPLDHVVEQEGSSAVGADTAAEATEPELSDSSAQPGDKKEPLLDDRGADPKSEQSVDETESGKGSEAANVATKPGKKKQTLKSDSEETKAETAETA